MRDDPMSALATANLTGDKHVGNYHTGTHLLWTAQFLVPHVTFTSLCGEKGLRRWRADTIE
eukprot:1902304-Amphidinium_carterae.2